MADTTSNLIRRWTLDDVLTESVGSGDFTLSGGSMAYRPGPENRAGTIPTGEQLLAGDLSDCDFGDTQSFTASGWFKFGEAPSDTEFLFGKKASNATSTPGWTIYRITAGNAVFMIADGTTRAFWISGVLSGGWTHIACTLDRDADVGSLYINGALVDNTPLEGPVSSVGSLETSEGVECDSLEHASGVDLDDLRIYDRALSADDVAALYAEGDTSNASYLLHRWQFDDDLVDSVAGDDFTLSAGSMSYGAGALSKQGIIPNGENVSAGDLADCDFGAEDSFTASGWIGLPSATSGPVTAMFGKRADAGSGSAGWLLYQTLGIVTVGVSDGANFATAGYANSGQDTQLKHFALVVDRSSDTLYLYVDGELSNSASVSSVGSLANSEGVRSSANSLTGDMGADDLRVYDRALSANDVAALYLEGRPPKLTHQCDLSASAVSALISDGVVDFGTHSISSARNSAIFSTDTGSGADVWFSSDADGAYPIAADIYYWSDGDSEFKAKVAAGALSAVSGGTIYLHVGSKPGGYDTDPYTATTEGVYPLASDFDDRSTNSNDGTGVGGVSAGSASTGPDGTTPATAFDGTDDRVTIPAGVQGNSDNTVQVWAKSTPVGAPGSNEFLFGTDGTNRYYMRVEATTGAMTARVGAGSLFGDTALGDDWQHIALVYDHSAGEAYIYIDGVLDETATSQSLTSNPVTQTIGAIGAGTSNFEGDLSGVQVHTAARTAAEINLDYLLEGSTASAYWTVTDITSQPSASFDLRSDREVVLSGSDVTSWGNASGGTSPSYSNDAADRILGFPAIQFANASSEHLRWDEIASMFSGDDADWTLAALIRPDITGSDIGFVGVGGSAGSAQNRFLVASTNKVTVGKHDGTSVINTSSSVNVVDDTPYLMIFKSEGGQLSYLYRRLDTDAEATQTADISSLGAASYTGGAVGSNFLAGSAGTFFNGDIARIRLYNTALGGDLTGDLTGTQLGDLKTLMLMTSGDSLGVAVGPAVGSAVRNIIRGF